MGVNGLHFEPMEWNNEQPIPFSDIRSNIYLAGNGLNGPSEMTSVVSDFRASEQSLLDIDVALEARSTVLDQRSKSYPAAEPSEIGPLFATLEGRSFSFPKATKALHSQGTEYFRTSQSRKRKRNEVTDANDIASQPRRRRQRGPFATAKEKEQTAETREIGACIRCSRQHVRVYIHFVLAKHVL